MSHNFSCKIADLNGFVRFYKFGVDDAFYFKQNFGFFPNWFFKNFVRSGNMGNNNGTFRLFGNSERAMAKFQKFAAFADPAFRINSDGAGSVFDKFGGMVDCFKSLAVIFAVYGKAGGFVQERTRNRIGMCLLFAYENYVALSEKQKRNSRIQPVDVVTDEKKISVFGNKFFSGDFYFDPENFKNQKSRLNKNVVIISVLVDYGLFCVDKKRKKSAIDKMRRNAEHKDVYKNQNRKNEPIPAVNKTINRYGGKSDIDTCEKNYIKQYKNQLLPVYSKYILARIGILFKATVVENKKRRGRSLVFLCIK